MSTLAANDAGLIPSPRIIRRAYTRPGTILNPVITEGITSRPCVDQRHHKIK
jgi:hypothetical protein